MIIQHNIMALNSYRQLNGNNNALSKNLEKLSSGYKVNRAGDDAAGLAISEKMRAQITGLETAQKNAQDGISMIQTAEGALTEVHSMLNRMVELATQAANGIYGDEERANIQAEIKSLNDEINRISEFTNFNGTLLLATKNTQTGGVYDVGGMNDGMILAPPHTNSALREMTLQVGDTAGQTIAVTIADMSSTALSKGAAGIADGLIEKGLTKADGTLIEGQSANWESLSDINVYSVKNANASIAVIKSAISQVSTQRASFGALQNRLEHTINNLGVTTENITAAESRIRDTDMAKEMMGYTKNNILVQAAQAMLAQANQVPQGVLQLLR